MKYNAQKMPLCFILIMFHSLVYAGEEQAYHNISPMHISEKTEYSQNTTGKPVFINSESIFSQTHKGDIFLFFSKAQITGKVEGRIYSFFSLVEISGHVTEGTNIFSSSATVTNSQEIVSPLTLFPADDASFFHVEKELHTIRYSNEFSPFVIQLFFCFLRLALCIIFISWKKSIFEQGQGALLDRPMKIIGYGLIVYSGLLLGGLVFLFSVIGIPITFILIACLLLFAVVGELVTGMSGSYLILMKFYPDFPLFAYANTLIGVIIIEILLFIPFVGWFIQYFLLPVLGAGILCAVFLNGVFKKKFYESPYQIEQTCTPDPHVDKILRS